MNFASRLGDRFKAEMAGRIVANISSAALIFALARLLGRDSYGLLFLAISVVSTFQYFSNLGIAKSAARYISEYKEQTPGQVVHIVRTAAVYNLVAIVVVSGILFASHRYISELIGEPRLSPFLLLGVLYLVFGTLMWYVRMILQGFEAIQSAALVHVVDRGSRLIFAVGSVILGYGALGAFGGYILAFFLASLVGFVILYVRHYRSYEADSIVEVGLRRRIAEYMVPISVTNTSFILDKRIDTVLVGYFLNPSAVGFYVLGKQVVEFVRTPADAIGFTLSPTFGAEKAEGNMKRASRLYETALVHTLLFFVPAAAGVVLVSEPLVTLVFGEEYRGAIPVLQVFGVYLVLESVTIITTNGLDYLGRARSRAIAKLLTSLLNVTLNIALIPVLGVVGAAIATVITYSLYMLANLYIVSQEFILRPIYLLRQLGNVLVITGIMSIGVFFLSLRIEGLISLFVTVIGGIVIWGTLSVVSGMLEINRIRAVFS